MLSNEWTELFPWATGSRVTDPVRLGMVRKGKNKPARCHLDLSPQIVEAIGAKGCKVKVRLGYGENAGCVQVIGDGSGPFHLKAVVNKCAGGRRPNGRYGLTLPVISGFPDIPTRMGPAKHRLVPVGAMKALIIDLPRVFLAEPRERR